MTTSIGEFVVDLHPLPTQPVIAVIAERDSFDDALIQLIRRLGFYAVLHDLDSPHPQPGYPVIAVTTSSRRVAALAAMAPYRLATIVGVGVDRSAERANLLSTTGMRRLLGVLGDAGAQHRQLRLSASA